MENATKALLIAGGVLIAIILISLLVRTYGDIGIFQKQQLKAEEIEQLAEFNNEYTKYENQYIYGADLITIINKTVNNNQKINNKIQIEITFTVSDFTYERTYWSFGRRVVKTITVKDGSTLSLKNEDDYTSVSGENVAELRNRAFLCDSIEYDNNTGMVNYIHFTEKKYTISGQE